MMRQHLISLNSLFFTHFEAFKKKYYCEIDEKSNFEAVLIIF